jgi:hypothetical protein
MVVISARLREKVFFPDSHTSVEVVSIQPGAVRFGVEPAPMDQVVARRLDIARRGLEEARRHLGDGRPGDAELLLGKLDEDLHLLRKRLRREAEEAAALSPRTPPAPAGR